MTDKDKIKNLENTIQVVNMAINVTNYALDKKSWRYKRNEMTKHDVQKYITQEILKLKSNIIE